MRVFDLMNCCEGILSAAYCRSAVLPRAAGSLFVSRSRSPPRFLRDIRQQVRAGAKAPAFQDNVGVHQNGTAMTCHRPLELNADTFDAVGRNSSSADR